MLNFNELKPEKVFEYFDAISKIPRGSGNMEKISDFCLDFAKKHSLKAIKDDACNVIIYKDGTEGYENSPAVILQGHLDMVCQREEDYEIDFEKDSLDLYVDGDYIKARGTTLGADNGIAVAMIMSILADNTISHPPIEAVFTTDEEVGMLGALELDMKNLKAKKMINIDSEDPEVVTVSCAGGSDFTAEIPLERTKKQGEGITVTVKGLKGGHSGVEINSGRVNANLLMGRILNHIHRDFDFDIISLDGGDKGNAIPVSSTAKIVCKDAEKLIAELKAYADVIKNEITFRESGFELEINSIGQGVYEVIEKPCAKKLIYILLCAPNGVVEMSAEIANLVETSLNMGILKTEEEKMTVAFALRSNKKTAMNFLEEKLDLFFSCVPCTVKKSGHYPPWEYNSNSVLQGLYKEKYKEKFGVEPSVEAIHAGLECGVFASMIEDFDCISIGPRMHGIHTVEEELSISSTREIYEIIINMLEGLR